MLAPSFSEKGNPAPCLAKEPLMNCPATVPAPTLWDLATVVLEEVEKVCGDERSAAALAREILIRIIQGHVRNMEVEMSYSHAVSREGGDRLGPGADPGRLGG
jgi:hypothetical protein